MYSIDHSIKVTHLISGACQIRKIKVKSPRPDTQNSIPPHLSLFTLQQVKPGFTNYQPHPSTLGPEVKQKQAWMGEGSSKRKEIQISKLENF